MKLYLGKTWGKMQSVNHIFFADFERCHHCLGVQVPLTPVHL